MFFHHAVEGETYGPLLERLGGERHAQGKGGVGQPDNPGKRWLANHQPTNFFHLHQLFNRRSQRLLRFIRIFMAVYVVIRHH
ncbi:hypothetical protein D3C87_2014090 [compost metagenome]